MKNALSITGLLFALGACTGTDASTSLSDTADLITQDYEYKQEDLDAESKAALEGIKLDHIKVKWKEANYRGEVEDQQTCVPTYKWSESSWGALTGDSFDCEADGLAKRKSSWERSMERFMEVEEPDPSSKLITRAGRVTGIVRAYELPYDLDTCIGATLGWIVDRVRDEAEEKCKNWVSPDMVKVKSWRDDRVKEMREQKGDAAELPEHLSILVKWLEGLNDKELTELYRYRGPGRSDASGCKDARRVDQSGLAEAAMFGITLKECIELGEKVTSALSGG